MKKWSPDELDKYVLLSASRGFVLRHEFLFVSHPWRTRDHPDPSGGCLRLHQAQLAPLTWSYIWVDWSCMPQSPRSLPEQAYFDRCLGTTSVIIRNCAFTHFYPPFEPRVWILYEITEYLFTCTTTLQRTSDIATFLQHIEEMLETGVQATLTKYGYRCSYDRDSEYLTSWLEVLVLLKRLHFSIGFLREVMDNMTWLPNTRSQTWFAVREKLEGFDDSVVVPDIMVLRRFEGTLAINETEYRFTPLPRWVRHPKLTLDAY
jgi:hypothetical protein